MRLKKTFPEKSSFASTLLVKISLKNSSLSSACTLLRFPASTLLRFYALGKFSTKKSTFACKHLRFYASEQFSQQISPFASELLCFYASRTIFPTKIILCFYASKKNFPEKINLCFYASTLLKKIFPEKITLCFYASSLLCF